MTKRMTGNQQYIGIPNGAVLCLNKKLPHGAFDGELFHGYNENGISVDNMESVIILLDDLFDTLQFPRASTTLRTFADDTKKETSEKGEKPPAKVPERVLTDDELLQKHGELATFIIRVQQRQNSTWQGRVTWREGDKTKAFSSKWELARLIELIVNDDESNDGCSQTSDWNK